MNKLISNFAYIASASLAVAAWQSRMLRAQQAAPAPTTAAVVAPAPTPGSAAALPSLPASLAPTTSVPVTAPVAADPAKTVPPAVAPASTDATQPLIVAQNSVPATGALTPGELLPLNADSTEIARIPINRVELLPGTPEVRAQRKAASEGRVLVSKKKRVAKKRKPASIDPTENIHTFDENTSFEKLVNERQSYGGRDPASFAPSARVIGVRRELGLTSADANAAPQDIILNAGVEAGLEEGMVVSVARSVPILDPYRENQQKQLDVEFAKVKVVRAEQGLAVARIERIEPIRTGLVVGTRAILVGDYVGKFTK